MFWASVSYKTECFYLDELRHAQDESGWPKDFPKARGLAKTAVWEKIVFWPPPRRRSILIFFQTKRRNVSSAGLSMSHGYIGSFPDDQSWTMHTNY